MRSNTAAQIDIAQDVILDGRLALFHRRQRWLAVADLHFGFELSHRAAGSLFPLWGMQTIQTRLEELLTEYNPNNLILLGDLVHDRTGAAALVRLVHKFGQRTTVVLIAGNHDRELGGYADVVPVWRSGGFCFHHGHCEHQAINEIQVIGHHHPAQVVRDGAGLRLKLPAFVQQDACWIMPAFSPWAAGAVWPNDGQSRIWLCSPTRIVPVVALASSQ